MKRVLVPLCFSCALNFVATTNAQDFYPDFALLVQLPSYDTFLTNLDDSPIRVDHYEIRSVSASLNPVGWASLDSAGPKIVATLGPGADQFDTPAAISSSWLAEFNLPGSATWQPGQTWSIGFPFNSDDPDFVLDAVFRFASPDGFLYPGGTVVAPGDLGRGAFLVISELAGDFNNDGTVDAADYVYWRKNFSGDQVKYDAWRANFGASLGSGSGAALSSAEPLSAAVPEPATFALLIMAGGIGIKRRRSIAFVS